MQSACVTAKPDAVRVARSVQYVASEVASMAGVVRAAFRVVLPVVEHALELGLPLQLWMWMCVDVWMCVCVCVWGGAQVQLCTVIGG